MPVFRSAPAVVVLMSVMLIACGPSRADLESDNPVRPNAAPPFGMEEFFKDVPQQPIPTRVRLGRWLFFDRRLSADNTLSCASCHRPELAFSQDAAVSTGINGVKGTRKAPSLVNLAARTVLPDNPDDREQTFFWDGRVSSLEHQVLVPIANRDEMGLDRQAMVDRFSALKGYRPYFKEAFGSDEITQERIATALSDYVRTRMSGNAPYDRWSYAGEGRAISDEAKRGSELFFFTARCATCHAGFNFSDGRFHRLGVGWDATTQKFSDEGRFAVSHEQRDRGAFKTPGLREVSKHPPYMHDGSLATLRDVVEFYNNGTVPSLTRPNGPPFRLIGPERLTERDIDALVAFLKTLDGEGYQDQSPKHFPR
jgi:cytochrome c peroxidase